MVSHGRGTEYTSGANLNYKKYVFGIKGYTDG
jgi:hypothetical protein